MREVRKRKLWIILWVSISSSPLLALELDMSLVSGYMNGQLRELVYRSYPQKLSELLWKLGHVLNTRAELSTQVDRRFWFSFRAALPALLSPGADAQQMVDRDWLYYLAGSSSQEASNTSWHRVQQQVSLQWRGALGVNLLSQSATDLIVGAALGHTFWSWTDTAHRYLYYVSAEGNPVTSSGSYDNSSITYQGSIWSIELFLRWRSPRWESYRLLAQLSYSPYTIWVAYDSHLKRSMLFRDSGDFGQLLRIELENELTITPFCALLFGGELVLLFESRGFSDSFELRKEDDLSSALARPPLGRNIDVGMSYTSYYIYLGARFFLAAERA